MKKTKRFFTPLVIFMAIAFFAATTAVFSAQSAKGEQAREEVLKASEQAKTEAKAKEEQDKIIAEKEAAQAKADAQNKSEQEKADAIKQKREIEAREQEAKAQFEVVVKTYSLKYINASDFVRAARFYTEDSTGSENTLTVRIQKRNIPAFEDLLKKIDVERKNIMFQVYTIVASREAPPVPFKDSYPAETGQIDNKELKKVLDEMRNLWNFKYYWVDAPSFLIVKDGSGSNFFKLVSSRFDFDMDLMHVQVKGEEPGKRIISIGQIQLNQAVNMLKSTLIDTKDITIKEKGYLVVGVSGIRSGWGGQALILVISIEIK